VRLAVVVLLATLAGCATTPVPPPAPIPGAPSCATACARLEELGCPAAKPTPAGGSCVRVCENIEDSGIIRYGVACVTTATTCDGADHCDSR
jgi:hypothetical protein